MDLPVTLPDIVCKIIIIGDSGVGKTTVARRFTRNSFSESLSETFGIDFSFKLVKVKNKMVKVQIWDTAGQEQYHCITSSYYRGAKAVIMAYDITERKSFENIIHWIGNFKQFGDDGVEKILIGNKCDLKTFRVVSKKEGGKLAEANNMFFSETSAKDNVNVENVFMKLLDQVVEKACEKEFEKLHDKTKEGKIILPLANNKKRNSKKQKCCSR